MCGIFSVVTNKEFADDFKKNGPNILQNGKRRGPDNSNYLFIDNKIFLGSNRLRIIGDDITGNMPMKSLMGNFWICFNGEIYNYKELKLELEKEGILFSSNTDTEVVLNAYVLWGENFISKLNGIFSFVIYDKENNNIIFSRDRFGAKPLYYYIGENFIGFNSDFLLLKKIIPGNKLEIDMDGLTSSLLCRFVPGNKTIFKNIYKVEPAELLTLNTKTLNINKSKYWRPNINLKDFSQEEFNLKLTTALVRTSISDVKPSILLSGGIDSSALLCELSNNTKNKFDTYCCSFKNTTTDDKLLDTSKITNGTLNENGKALEVAKKFNANHTNYIIDSLINLGDFKEMQESLGEPIMVPNALGLYLFAKKLKGKTKLVLSGTGADELLGGYEELYFNNISANRKTLSNQKLLSLFYDFDNGNTLPLNLLKKDLHSEKYLEEYTNNYLECFSNNRLSEEYLNQLSVFELGFALPNWELDMADRLFMYNSIELRPSFLENDFLDYCLTIPSSNKKEKSPLKTAMKEKLPLEIVSQKKIPSLSTPMDFLNSTCFKELYSDLKNSPLDIWDENTLHNFVNKPYSEISFDLLYRVLYLQFWIKNFFNKDYNFIKITN